jgi:lysophospholipase L1-like esterase
MRRVNRLVADYCRAEPNLKYVDVFTPMLDRTGRPRPELFQADQLHMNRSGYEIWIRALGPIVDAS